jgi:Mitochondrial import receptor subunit or translocase
LEGVRSVFLQDVQISISIADELQAAPQLSAAEIKAQEEEASRTIRQALMGAIVLYFCTSSVLNVQEENNLSS